MKPLSATARLQFHKDFTLDDATALVPYFAKLGISHLYASPLLKARAGSTHGYDIVDHNQINPELGGEEALRRLVAALRAHDMGLSSTSCPTTWASAATTTPGGWTCWNGAAPAPMPSISTSTGIRRTRRLRGRMLAPFLGSSYGECLQKGELVLKFDETDGRLFVAYYTHRFPITPRDYAAVLLTDGGPLEAPARAVRRARPGRPRRGARRGAAKPREELLQPAYADRDQ